MNVENSMILTGLLVAIGIGIAIGIGNYALIKLLRIPPIIATLSMSFIVQSTAIWTNRGLRIKPPSWLADFTTATTAGIPNVALVALVLSVIVWYVINRTVYGRSIAAIGQSIRLPAWPAFRSTARGLSPTCFAPCSLPSAAICLPASPAVQRSTWAPNIS